MQYKWGSPYDWLAEKARDWGECELYSVLITLAAQVDSDMLQDLFQAEMDRDGYFKKVRR